MIFASDLDRTLVYSVNSAEMPITDLITVERTKSEKHTYMTDNAIRLLKEISSKMLFIPVTTRTVEQYKRIFIFQQDIKPKYAVTSNGGNILVDGVVDMEWKQIVAQKSRTECLPLADILTKFAEIKGDWLLKGSSGDDLFHYFIVDNQTIPHDKVYLFVEWLKTQGWIGSLQGRKLYFVPKHINKWDPIYYLKVKTKSTFVAATGDSLLDLCMLEAADWAMIPRHGELLQSIQNINSTSYSGILSSEELLKSVLEAFNEKVNL